MSEQAITHSQPKFLWFLTLSYTTMLLLANWFDPRIVSFFSLNTDAGTLVFPFTFLLSDLITEVYGYKFARRAIWCGFLFNCFFILYAQLVIHMPSPSYPTDNSIFDQILSFNTRIIIASTISYFCSEPFNSYVLAKLKILTKGRYIALRFVSSTLIAAGVDSFIFTTLAFYKTMPNQDLIIFILSMWLIKVIIEIVGLPLSLSLVNKLKRIERLDVYDTRTKFNVFSLNTLYQSQDNHFNSLP